MDHYGDGIRTCQSSQLHRKVELMNTGIIVDDMILICTNNVSSDSEECQRKKC